ncbi:EVE domain-containing protein [Vogesella indigofera]|uniref:EVE domain-containing protein n=1 Tax=Vogesella indigofera TaxID=45465 RepID=UPI0035B1FCE3
MSRRYWIGVACREHVARGVAGGFAQLCHGKAAPLARMAAGDGLVYYSPQDALGSPRRCQAFTAIGSVCAGAPYRVSMDAHFRPWRRDVAFVAAQAAPIRPLLTQLAFITDPARWGYPLRFGQLQISAADFYLIAAAMQAALPATLPPAPAYPLFDESPAP